jgi:hypothetical protein
VCACVAYRWVEVIAWVAITADLVSISHGSAFNADVSVTSLDLLAAAAGGAVVAVGLWRLDVPARSAARRSAIVGVAGINGLAGLSGLAGVAAAAVLVTGMGAVLAKHGAPIPTALDRALEVRANGQNGQSPDLTSEGVARANSNTRPVMVIGDTDLFAAMGLKLNYKVVAPGQGGVGEIPITNSTQLDRILGTIKPAAVVVGPLGQPGVISDWVPPGYALVGIVNGNREYVARSTPPVPKPPTTTLPSVPNTTLPSVPNTTLPSTPFATLPTTPSTTLPAIPPASLPGH